MVRVRGSKAAFGAPGMEPRWTHGNKDGVGTAYSTASKIWYTLWRGVVTEVYYPTVDKPQVRDLQLLVTDGQTFFHEEKRHLISKTERISKHALAHHIVTADPNGRYSIEKEVLTDPHTPCLLHRVRLKGPEEVRKGLRLYALCAPHLEVGGWGNNGYVMQVAERQLLAAEKNGTWMALGGDSPLH